MTDPVALVLVAVWLLSPFAALGVLAWVYRRERARAQADVAARPRERVDWAPEWGPDWP